MIIRSRAAIVAFALAASSCGSPGTAHFIATTAPTLALSHARLIDGTGAPAVDDQTLVVENGRITAVGAAGRIKVPAGARVLDLHGRTVFPGLVGMHEHLFYEYGSRGSSGLARAEHTFAKLYLASGVTTIRTAGAADFAADARLKRAVDDGREPGPDIHLTGTYLYAAAGDPDPAAIVRQVDADAERGATSFKAYQSLRAPELHAAIQAAHAHGLRITGHLCAVGYREAAQMGIDNIEHGLLMDTDFDPDKQPDVCPNLYDVFDRLERLDDSDAAIRGTIAALVQHGVAVTSTLAITETFTSRDFAFDPRTLRVLAPGLQDIYRQSRADWIVPNSRRTQLWTAMLRKEMSFERAFAAAGGRLLAGADPTGWGGIVAGFADERELELLVEAGFTPEQAIKIATSNGAAFLFESNDIGTIAPGKRADLVVVRGNPSVHIADVRNVEQVFKNGVGYDPAALTAAAEGSIHQYDFWHILYSPGDMALIAVVGALFVAVVVRRTRRFRQAVASTVKPVKPARPVAALRESPVVHTRWRTVHKGHANIGNGVYIREDDDLVVNTPMPIVLRRTYNSGDRFARPFGLATTHAGEWWLHGNGDQGVPWGELILADGARIRFERITPGPTEEGAVLRHDSTPTEFNGSFLSFTGALWELRFPDGSFASFGPPKVCFLQERRDADGHRIQYVRDASNTLLRMESEGQIVALEYDAQKRIVRASDTTGKDVSYGYDDLGRLVRAAGNNGVVRQYEYDERNNMVAIREPGRIVRNWFDEKGRWSRQVVKSGEDDSDPYVATAHYVVEGNSIVETDFDEGDGLNVFRFNEHHYVLSETLDADGDAPIVFTYDRDEITNVLKGATLSCRAASGPISRRVRVESGNDKAVRDALVRENCLRRP